MQLPNDIVCRRLTYEAKRRTVWEALLPPEEQERLYAFAYAKRQREFLLGRVAARQLLAERLGVSPREVPLRVASDGAVEVEGSRYAVSIAHSEEHAVAVIAERAVGVDLEQITSRRSGLERMLLHPDEQDLFERLPFDKTRGVILCWTLKEAVLKAMRTGLRCWPNRLRLKVDPAEQSARLWMDGGPVWQARFEEWDGNYLAVAYEPEGVERQEGSEGAKHGRA